MTDPGNSRQTVRAAFVCGPGLIWLLVFLLVPMLLILSVSFISRGAYGELEWTVTLENYRRLIGFGALGFDPLYPQILLRSLALGATTAFLCLLMGMPLAFFIARLPGRFRAAALLLVVIPFWTSLLIRTYAWQILLAPEGWFGSILRHLGMTELYPGTLAVLIGMVCDFLPFFVLPLYASVEKINWSLAEAAMDLGASQWNVFRHAILPQISPGLTAGLILVFLPATGQFVIPDLLGGAKTVLLGNAIQQQFGQSRDWPFGAAMAVAALALVIAGMWLFYRKSGQKGEWL